MLLILAPRTVLLSFVLSYAIYARSVNDNGDPFHHGIPQQQDVMDTSKNLPR